MFTYLVKEDEFQRKPPPPVPWCVFDGRGLNISQTVFQDLINYFDSNWNKILG